MNLNEHNHFTLRITQVFTQLLTEPDFKMNIVNTYCVSLTIDQMNYFLTKNDEILLFIIL